MEHSIGGARAEPVRRARGVDLSPAELYGLLRLRVDVFVVEQRCAYAELDGRDLEPGTVHFWTGEVAPEACLRLLAEPDRVRRIGRVCVAPQRRGRGDAGRLMRAALADIGGAACVLDAQEHLTALYGGFGFVPDGPGYDWDGMPHVPMRRPGPPSGTITAHGPGRTGRGGGSTEEGHRT